jgi:hypothetical protein
MLKLFHHFAVHRSRHLQAIHPKMATAIFAPSKPPECRYRLRKQKKDGLGLYFTKYSTVFFIKHGIGEPYFESSS